MILCVTAQVITVYINLKWDLVYTMSHCLLGYLLSSRELPAKVNKARGAMIHWESIIEESTLKIWGLITLWGQFNHVFCDVRWLPAYESFRLTIHRLRARRAFWGADDEGIPEGRHNHGSCIGYDGLPLQPVAPPSPDFILGPENPQTPPVPQEEDEREPLFIQAHDPNYVPEPIYPEYIPLEDDHEFPAEEQPLPPIDSPTAESPGYITESDPEEDPEGYEDDETEDGPVDYPMDGGDDGDDDDGDSSRDDARD
ncbi:hypothetical protein Tco_1057382 [Tanacetum coccineum]|uniref:Uncharacterized protein n=1 Tax=Tanacetum coccineum TaxID=301880 RepID=A0ABQ5H6N0_9ASTR